MPINTKIQRLGFNHSNTYYLSEYSTRKPITTQWWQVITIVTVLLSLSSLFLSINQITPESIETEFRIIDQSKASLYIIYSELSAREEPSFSFIKKFKKDEICNDSFEAEFLINQDKTLRDKNVAISNLEKRVLDIESRTMNQLIKLKEDSNIQELFVAANRTLVERKIFFEKKYILDQELRNVYTFLSQICLQKDKEKVLENLEFINKALIKIANLQGINKEELKKAEYLVNNWTTSIDKLNEPENIFFLSSKELDSFLTILDNLDGFHDIYLKYKAEWKSWFLELEKWQIKFASSQPELFENLILIKEFDNVSSK